MSLDIQSEIRQEIIDELKMDLIGPRKGDTDKERQNEITERNPKEEYVAGVLFPRNWNLEEDDLEQENGGDSDEEDGVDRNISKKDMFKPSSFGLTCRLDTSTKKFKARIKFATYQSLQNEQTNKITYHRHPYEQEFEIDVDDGANEEKLNANNGFAIKYKILKNHSYTILDFYLVNNTIKKQKNSLLDFIFQPEIILESIDNQKIFLEDKEGFIEEFFPADDKHLDILFKDKISFGKGHLCALTWDKNDVFERKIHQIRTTFTPNENIDVIKHVDSIKSLEPALDMIKLSECENPKQLSEFLEPLVIEYQKWLENKIEIIKHDERFSKDEKDIIFQKIEIAKKSIERMRLSIQILEKNNEAFESFKFANLSMAWAQSQGTWAKENAEMGEVNGVDLLEPIYKDKRPAWRMFQIAFILTNLESIINPNSDNRETVDLLWFPTGGGKTEAYLGLVAFVIAFRRLRMAKDGDIPIEALGTAVIMRYTLRLLTVQQFQRASTLMCACEKIRISNRKKWGNDPFQVGLWAGSSVTPNSRESALQKRNDIKYSHDSDLTQIKSSNPYVLINCPWCGKKLTYNQGLVTGEPEQWRLFCSRNDCLFSNHIDSEPDVSLPVVLVDEDIYSRCPCLIIATVDKFAQITFKQEVKNIFGNVNSFCDYCGFFNDTVEKHPDSHRGKDRESSEYITKDFLLWPPEMIIQDELHLISGPLGTLAGLYETAIESFCERDGNKPKIIASTATTRSAQDQIQRLFNRDTTRIFPPQIDKFGDTFFSKVESDSYGKTYFGLLATGKSGLTILAKVSAVILRCIRRFEENGKYEKENLDPYFTLVSYFNSIRELGGASMNFKDSVPNFIEQIVNNFEKKSQLPVSGSTKEVSIEEETEEKTKVETTKVPIWETSLRPNQFNELKTEELTSRKNSGEIPEILRELEKSIDKIPPPVKGEKDDSKQPIDLLMATNMLQVGVDIGRLGVMIVNGQPKHNSEYIQATGRIGRNNPGLIVTLYSYTRPRDISHFENFKIYHSTFYKNVETVSLTPFTKRARDTGLFGLIVGLIRMSINAVGANDLGPQNNAHKLDLTNRDQIKLINSIKEIIKKRVSAVEIEELEDTMSNIDYLFNQWTREVRTHKQNLRYTEPYSEYRSLETADLYRYLLKTDSASERQAISVPNSLRNAEQEQNLRYIDFDQNELDEDELDEDELDE